MLLCGPYFHFRLLTNTALSHQIITIMIAGWLILTTAFFRLESLFYQQYVAVYTFLIVMRVLEVGTLSRYDTVNWKPQQYRPCHITDF